MSRKERKEAARKRKYDQITEWNNRLANLMKDGMNLPQAMKVIQKEADAVTRNNPQQRQELTTAWVEFNSNVNLVVDAMIQSEREQREEAGEHSNA